MLPLLADISLFESFQYDIIISISSFLKTNQCKAVFLFESSSACMHVLIYKLHMCINIYSWRNDIWIIKKCVFICIQKVIIL